MDKKNEIHRGEVSLPKLITGGEQQSCDLCSHLSACGCFHFDCCAVWPLLIGNAEVSSGACAPKAGATTVRAPRAPNQWVASRSPPLLSKLCLAGGHVTLFHLMGSGVAWCERTQLLESIWKTGGFFYPYSLVYKEEISTSKRVTRIE